MGANILTNRGDFLRIFTQGITIDKSLPKHVTIEEIKKGKKLVSMSVTEMMEKDVDEFNTLVGIPDSDLFLPNGDSWGENNVHFSSIKGWLINKIASIGSKEKTKEKPEIDIIEFFSRVKIESEEIGKNYYDRIKPYLKQLNNAKALGQTALYDELLLRITMVKFESLLVAGGFNKRITEEQIVKFVKMTEKGLRLDYVANFGRPVPEDVIKRKCEADKLHVFDNYVVLHFDPEQKSYKQTEKEKEEKRKKKADPILFGVIHGIKNLYYIADWIDEYCDLTLDQFMDTAQISTEDITIKQTIDFKAKK